VYGGAASIMIGSYSRSYSGSRSATAQSGDTYCIGCTVNVSDVTITNSEAVSGSSKLWAAFHALQCRRCVRSVVAIVAALTRILRK
jgi:hypothetical protein